MRITTRMAVGTLVNNLDRSYERIVRFQNELSSGTRLNSLSDDPAGIERSLAMRSELRNAEQFKKNISDGIGWLELSEATLSEMEALFVQVRGLAIQGSTSTFNAEQRNAIAGQVDQLLEHVQGLSEARYRGRYIFAGTQTADVPYVPDRANGVIIDVKPRGRTDGSIEREISDGIVMQVNVPGNELFEGDGNAFTTLIELRDALRDNAVERVGDSLTGLAEMRERISSVRGLIGARVNRMEITQNVLDRMSVEMTTILSEDEDVDLASTIVNLQQEQDVFQAALASGSVVVPQSLMDFI